MLLPDQRVARPEHKEKGALEDQIQEAGLARRINRLRLDLGRDFNGQLYAFQSIGARFLLAAQKGLLGDEMGLGKTVEALAALVHLSRQQQAFRALIVCPATVVLNWQDEVGKFTQLRALVLKGPDREAGYTRLGSGKANVGILSFETFLRDYPLGGRLPSTWSWQSLSVLIVDEAQRIRNPDSRTAMTVKDLARHLSHVFLLSGTPLENKAEDFHSLSEALGSPLGSLSSFQRDLANWSGSHLLRKKAAHFYLRRKKDDVFEDLPEVVRQNVYLDLSPQQTESYVQVLATMGDGWDAIMKLRQVVNLCPFTGTSTKLEFVQDFLAECREEGDKLVVFSFFLSVLDQLEKLTRTPFRIDGKVSAEKRKALIDEFSGQTGHAVMLMQIKAGGVGLNLQAANRVLLFEPQWNPAAEEQAIARVHRIKQMRTVHVVRLMTRNTIEERMEAVLEKKRDLFRELVDEAELTKRLNLDWKRVLDEERTRLGVVRRRTA